MNNKEQIQDWVYVDTKPHEFGFLISSLRGIDIDEPYINTNCKKITKMIRYLITNPYKEGTGYCDDKILPEIDVAGIMIETREYSEHWYEHTLLAMKIIKNKHPNPYVRKYWYTVLGMIK